MHTTASCPKRAACCAGSTPFAVSAEPCRLLGYTRAVRASRESSQSSASPASIPLPPPLAQETPQHPSLDGVGVDSPSPGGSSALSQFGLGRWDADPNFGCHYVPKRGWQVTSAKSPSAASGVLLRSAFAGGRAGGTGSSIALGWKQSSGTPSWVLSLSPAGWSHEHKGFRPCQAGEGSFSFPCSSLETAGPPACFIPRADLPQQPKGKGAILLVSFEKYHHASQP